MDSPSVSVGRPFVGHRKVSIQIVHDDLRCPFPNGTLPIRRPSSVGYDNNLPPYESASIQPDAHLRLDSPTSVDFSNIFVITAREYPNSRCTP